MVPFGPTLVTEHILRNLHRLIQSSLLVSDQHFTWLSSFSSMNAKNSLSLQNTEKYRHDSAISLLSSFSEKRKNVP